MSRVRRRHAIAWIAAGGLLFSTNAFAATWLVPGDASTIQAGIALAGAAGDTVEVAPGTWSGDGNRNLDFGGKALVLRSSGGAAVTILDLQALGRGFIFQGGEDSTAVVEGFTITNGRTSRGGAFFLSGAAPWIRDCVLVANRADESGGAVWGVFGAHPRLLRCRIENNTAFLSGGGVSLVNSSARIDDCEVTGNTAGILGGGIYLREASPTVTDTRIAGNTSNGAGGGLVVYHLSAPVVTRCTLAGNRASGSGGGVFCDDFADPMFIDCVVTGNRSDFSGGGLLCTGRSTARLAGTTVASNQGVEAGGGLYAVDVSSFTLERTILWGNCAPSGAQAFTADLSSQVTFACSVVDSAAVDGPGSTNYGADVVFTDPRFCSPLDCAIVPSPAGDFSLDAGSPCLAAVSPCGQRIGALESGCGVTGTPDHVRTDGSRTLSCSPTPFRDRVRIESRIPAMGRMRTLAIHDLAGRRVRSLELAGPNGAVAWDGLDQRGRPAPAGIYFLRLSGGDVEEFGRVEKLR
jgi:parallel beta-helix repeat protein